MAYLDPSELDRRLASHVAEPRRRTPDFDCRGRPLLYCAEPYGAYCPECVRLGAVPTGHAVSDAVPRSRGIGGRCDGCGQLCRAPAALEPSCVAVEVSRALNAHEPLTEDDGWATTRRPSLTVDTPAVVELFLGGALYRCVVERVA